MPDIHIRIPAQKDMAHARHAVLGLLLKVIGMNPPRITALRIAEKRPVKLRLVDVFAAVQAEDRNGTPEQKDRRGEYGDVAVERDGIEILLAESPAGLQSGIWSLRGIYSGRKLWRQRL